MTMGPQNPQKKEPSTKARREDTEDTDGTAEWDVDNVVRAATEAGDHLLPDTVLEPFLNDSTQLSKLVKQLAARVTETDGLREQLALIQQERDEAMRNAEDMRDEYFELLRTQRTRENTPTPTLEPSRKSTKIPDPRST